MKTFSLLNFDRQRGENHWLEYIGLRLNSKRLPQDRHIFCLEIWKFFNIHKIFLHYIITIETYNSGAAYGGDPQKVSNFIPGTNSLLKPKSAILIFISPSNKRFSACKSSKHSVYFLFTFFILTIKWLLSNLCALFAFDDNTEQLKQSAEI